MLMSPPGLDGGRVPGFCPGGRFGGGAGRVLGGGGCCWVLCAAAGSIAAKQHTSTILTIAVNALLMSFSRSAIIRRQITSIAEETQTAGQPGTFLNSPYGVRLYGAAAFLPIPLRT